MAKADEYRLGPDVPDIEDLHDGQGRLIDDDYVDGAVEDALAEVRRRGRPSLSRSGESPLLRVRISRDLDEAVRKAADSADVSRSEWVRRVLDEATRRAS
jgi:predicted HicB family RNase H-like nuclease